MKLYSYRDPVGNFGDDLNLWLWPRLAPGIFDVDDGRLFLGIGTLLNHRLPADIPKVVFGTGAGYGEAATVDENLRIYCVRGPLSARALNLPSRLAITDPGVLVRELLPSDWSPEDSAAGPDLSFMPHHRTMGSIPWEHLCRPAGIRLIDPRGPFLTTLRAIGSSRRLVTESLHGAVVADALGIPWLPIRIFPFVLDYKWEDWCASMGLSYTPIDNPPIRARRGLKKHWKARIRATLLIARLRRVGTSLPAVLSDRARLQDKSDQLLAEFQRLRVEQLPRNH